MTLLLTLLFAWNFNRRLAARDALRLPGRIGIRASFGLSSTYRVRRFRL